MNFVFSRMISPTHFEPYIGKGTKRYGSSAIQPSVGDAGAPVFTFIGKHSIVLEMNVSLTFKFILKIKDLVLVQTNVKGQTEYFQMMLKWVCRKVITTSCLGYRMLSC